MQKTLVILCLILITLSPLFSQSVKKFHTTYYTTENGLPSNGIKGIQWDEENGFLWIATEAGISRFNGLDFKNFTVENTPIIRSERMMFIIKNNKNKIYSADQSGNIISIQKNNIRLFHTSIATQAQRMNKRFTLNVSDTFFLSQANYDSKRPINLLYDYVIPVNDSFTFIVHAGRIYNLKLGESDVSPYGNNIYAKGGFILNKKRFYITPGDSIISLNNDPSLNKYVMLLDENGNPFNKSDKTGRIFWTNGMAQPVLINKNKAWLLSSANESGIIATLICDEIPVDALIEYVQYSQSKKLLFIGTDSKGLVVVSGNRVTTMKSSSTGFNQRNAYYSQLELNNGNILTNEGVVIGPNTNNAGTLPITGKFSFLTSSTSDSSIWYTQFQPEAGYSCPSTYNAKTKITKIYSKIKCADLVVKELSNGRIFVATEYGFAYLTADTLQYLYKHPGINYNNSSYRIEETEPGKLLLATCAGLLSMNLSTGKIDSVVKSPGICFRSSFRYKDYIFFGTYGTGYYIWRNGKLKSMPLDKRKYLLYTHCFMPDDEGFCWISTNRGLFKANMDEMLNAFEKNLTGIYYHYFGKNDGMEMMEMNGGCSPCALQLRNKTISFPTMDGLLWVNPETAKPVLPDGEIFVDEINADSIILNPVSEKIILPAKTRDILISLSFSAWSNKENIYLEYQLNDTLTWKPVNTDIDAVIRLINLNPGDYYLRIRKMNGYGVNNYSYKTISFSITVPWYKKWWFNLLALLAIGGLISLYVRYRTIQLKKNQARLEKLVSEKTKELQEKNEVLEKNDSIKTRLISIISHDIVTPLKFLTSAGKNLIERKNQMPESLQEETLREMTNTSQELQMLSTNILNWIKFQNENRRLIREHYNLSGLVEQVIGILKSLAKSKNLVLQNNVYKDITIYQYFEPVKILVYNLLTNAINFSEQGLIRINGKKEGNSVVIEVEDEGVGMTAEQVQHLLNDEIVITATNIDNKKGHGLGFLIIKDLLKMTGGSMIIKSEKDKGSKITIILPSATNQTDPENS